MSMNNYEQRRRLAEGLRELAASAGPEGIPDGEVLEALGIGFGIGWDYSDARDVERLADLIDRPTCNDLGSDAAGYDFVCSRCGFLSDLVEPKYCPNCGAEVVE